MPSGSARNPYIGPGPFKRDDKDWFFGRDREIGNLVRMIKQNRTVLLYARSGVGKSSLLNAGLIPLLADFDILPPARVQGQISEQLDLQDLDQKVDFNIYVLNSLISWIQEEVPQKRLAQKSLTGFFQERGISKERTTLIIFDQFEELFTSYPERLDDREYFFHQVWDALEEFDQLKILFAMREDYIAELEGWRHLVPTKKSRSLRLKPLRREQASEAIQGPALKAGFTFAAKVVDRLLDELLLVRVHRDDELIKKLGKFVEPAHLQVVCHNLLEKLTPGETEISLGHLDSFGDPLQAMVEFYDSVCRRTVERATVSEGKLRRWIKDKLITSAKTRSMIHKAKDVDHTAGLPTAALKVLEKEHLIRSVSYGDSYWYELSHNNLIEPILLSNERWLDEKGYSAKARDEFEGMAEKWEESNWDPELLLIDREMLSKAERFIEGPAAEALGASGTLGAFIASSRASVRSADEQQKVQAEIKAAQKRAEAAEVQAESARKEAEARERQAESARRAAESSERMREKEELANRRYKRLHPILIILVVIALLGSFFALLQWQTAKSNETRAIIGELRAQRAEMQAEIRAAEAERARAEEQGRPEQAEQYRNAAEAARQQIQRLSNLIRDFGLDPDMPPEQARSRIEEIIEQVQTAGARALSAESQRDDALVNLQRSQQDVARLQQEVDQARRRESDLLAASANAQADREDLRERLQASDSQIRNMREQITGKEAEIEQLKERAEQTERALADAQQAADRLNRQVQSADRSWEIAAQSPAFLQAIRDSMNRNPHLSLSLALYAAAAFSSRSQPLTSDEAQLLQQAIGSRTFTGVQEGRFAYEVALSPDGTQLANAATDGVGVWDFRTGQKIFTSPPLLAPPISIAYSPDGNYLASVSIDGTIHVWYPGRSTGQSRPPLEIVSGRRNPRDANLRQPLGTTVAYDPEGQRLATGSEDEDIRRIKIWQAFGRQQASALMLELERNEQALDVAFAPRIGQRLAAATSDGRLKIFEPGRSPKASNTIDAHSGPVLGIAFSPDGQRLASVGADSLVKVWNWANGEQLLALRGHRGRVRRVVFSSDGKRLATAGLDDGTARVWDPISGQQLLNLSDQASSVWDVDLSSDGNLLAISRLNGSLTAHILDLRGLVALAKSRLQRPLTADECKQYLKVESCPPLP